MLCVRLFGLYMKEHCTPLGYYEPSLSDHHFLDIQAPTLFFFFFFTNINYTGRGSPQDTWRMFFHTLIRLHLFFLPPLFLTLLSCSSQTLLIERD